MNFWIFWCSLFGFWFPPFNFFFKLKKNQFFYWEIFWFGYIFTLFIFFLQVKVHLMEAMCSMIWVNTHLRIRMIRTSLGFILALMEFEGWPFNYSDNWMGFNCIGNGMQKGKRDEREQCHLQSNFHHVKVLHPHLNPHLHCSHPLSHLFRHDRSCHLWDLMGPKMIHFLEFSMKLS